ncbi:hypothetical protein [Paludisphaera borealis]|uniref:Uncharacterized protein n=1 Tax=Paludisphaera borealis TaxID=1387353 RepID=A0A1U7CVE2_9BACT|nr:hypothetical protein [Paludisphaera borealis]APW62917.1 hypothetical protein BSF38_04473 [Paludisphaera borealis]
MTDSKTSLEIVFSTDPPILWANGEGLGLGVWLFLIGAGLVGLVMELVRFSLRVRRAALQGKQARRAGRESRADDFPDGLAAVALIPKEPNFRDSRYGRYAGPFHPEDGAKPGPPMPWGKVASPALRGRVALVSMFIGSDGRSWTDSEIARWTTSIEWVARWIRQEADRYGAEVAVGVADTYFSVEGDRTPETEIGYGWEGAGLGLFEMNSITRSLTLMSRAAAQLGFHDSVDFVREVGGRLGSAIPVWLLHLRRAGRSFAVPLDLTELDGVSLALCYAHSKNFSDSIVRSPTPDAAMIAHEVLHLFGASDKYGVPLASFRPGLVTNRDIMRMDVSRLERLRVDPLTARELGWGDAAPVSKPEEPAGSPG